MLNRRKYCSVHNFDILKIPTSHFIPSVSIECPLKKNSHNCVREASTSRWRGLIRSPNMVSLVVDTAWEHLDTSRHFWSDGSGVGATAQVIHLKKIENLHHKKCIDCLPICKSKMILNTAARRSLFWLHVFVVFLFCICRPVPPPDPDRAPKLCCPLSLCTGTPSRPTKSTMYFHICTFNICICIYPPAHPMNIQ